MRYLDNSNILCLEYSELVPAIIRPDTYNKHRQREKLTVHGHGGNGRNVLIEYESMEPEYRLKVTNHYGDPYAYASKQPILDSVIWDYEAYMYYSNYTLPSGDVLSCSDSDLHGKPQINYVTRYTENASWLNMLGRMTSDKQTLKRELNISIMSFWDSVTELIRTKNIAIPTTPKRLKSKLKDYLSMKKDHGAHSAYEFLIEKHKSGNSHSKKVRDEVAEAFLKELLSKNHDDEIVWQIYNKWALENGRKVLKSAHSLGYRRKKWHNELCLEREGIAKVNKKYSKKIKGKRPSAPLLLVNSDDNVLDLFFKKWDGEGKNNWYRPVLYVVMDAFNDYPLGYAWGDIVTIELIKEAYRNAQRYVQQVTGDSYGWQELKTDKWGLDRKQENELGRFYRSMAISTPSALKNPDSRYIERAFGTTWHQLLKLMAKGNYSGYNITSKNQINRDNLKPNQFPYVEDADEIIATFISAYRRVKNKKTGKSRHEEWIEAFQASMKSKEKLWSVAERLQIFGKRHTHLNRINNYGLNPTLNGLDKCYEMSQEDIYQHINKEVMTYYDEHDLSKVLITDNKGLRMVLNEWKETPRAIADFEEGDADRINRLQEEKKTLLPMIQKKIDKRKRILERERIDAESRINAGVMVKEIAHADTNLLQSGQDRYELNKHELEEQRGDVIMTEDMLQSTLQNGINKSESIWDKM